jgi:hypothetical protein
MRNRENPRYSLTFCKGVSSSFVDVHVSNYQNTCIPGYAVSHVSKITIREMFSLISRD